MAAGDWRTDASLVTAVRRGDEAAFASLYERWFRPTLAVAEEVIGHRPRATQVVTDTFQTCYESLHELPDARRFGPWLLDLCREAARQERAARPPAPVLTGKPELSSLFSSLPDLQGAVAKVLARRGVPAELDGPIPARAAPAPVGPDAPADGGSADPLEPLALLANGEELAARYHRYDAQGDEGRRAGGWRQRLRLSAGGTAVVAVVGLGGLLWAIGGGDPATTRQPYSVQAVGPEVAPERAVGVSAADATEPVPATEPAPAAPVVVGDGTGGAAFGAGNQLAPQVPGLKVAGRKATSSVPSGTGVSSTTAIGRKPTPATTARPATQPTATATPTTARPVTTVAPTAPPTSAPTTVPPTTKATNTPTTKATTTTTAKATTTTTAKATTTAKVTTTTTAKTTTTSPSATRPAVA